MPNSDQASYYRNFIFGVEDSLVSTVGLLSGVAVSGVPGKTILLTGSVLIMVEAFSMMVGSFLSEYSAEEYVRRARAAVRRPLLDAVIMFFSYLLSGLIPLAPYAFLPAGPALFSSVSCSLLALFALGLIGAKLSRTSWLVSGARMTLIGGAAIVVGILVGRLAVNL